MIAKNPLTSLFSTSEGVLVLFYIAVQYVSVYLEVQPFDDANEEAKWAVLAWLGARFGLKGTASITGKDPSAAIKERLTDFLDKMTTKKTAATPNPGEVS